MKTKLFFFLFPVFLFANFNPVNAQITFEKTFRFSGDNAANDIKQTSDGGYVITGSANQVSTTGSSIFLIKTDASGDTLWSRVFNDTALLSGNSVAETVDGGFIIAGTKVFYSSGLSNAFLIKTDAAGGLLWSREIDDTTYDYAYGIVQTSDNGFVFSGFESTGLSRSTAILVKTDSNGIVLWSKKYGNSAVSNYSYSLKKTADGGFILGGTGNGSGTDFMMIKTDSSGKLQWQKSFGDVDYDENYSIAQTYDGGFIVAGTNYDPVTADYEVNVVRTNAAGTIVWTRNYGDNGGGDPQGAYAIIATPDSAFVFAGYSAGAGSSSGSWLSKINRNGAVVWSRITPSIGYDAFYSLQQTADGGFIAAGSKNRNFGVSGDISVVKTDANGISSCNQSVIPLLSIPSTQEVNSTDSASSFPVTINTSTSVSRGCTVANVCSGDPTRLVWPGDCNYDLNVTNHDFLFIGLAYGDTGSVRTGASLNWTGQPATPWIKSFTSGINHKHADCNGDGIVDGNDAAAISLNYSLTHPLRMNPQHHPAAVGDFFLLPDQSIIRPGDTVTFAIHLGTSLVPIDSIYGISFSFSFDPSLTDTNQISISYSTSVMGTINGNMKSFEKDFYAAGTIDAALCRIDHTNASQVQGILGNLTLVASNSILAITTLYVEPFNVRGLTSGETSKTFNLTGSFVIIDPGLGIKNLTDDSQILIYPNPANEKLILFSKHEVMDHVVVYDVSGRIIFSVTPSASEIIIPVNRFEAGFYSLTVTTGKGMYHKNIQVIH